MQKLPLSLALISLITLIPIVPAQASTEQQCLSAIADAQQRLQGKLNVDIITRVDDQSKFRSDYPKGRPMSYTFGFKGSAAKTLMNSFRLQESVATQIITGCTSLSAITFGYWNSGWFQTYGIMPDGKIQPFECIELDIRNSLKWGQVICI